MVASPYLVHIKISLSFFPLFSPYSSSFRLFYLFALVLLLEGVTYQLSSSVLNVLPSLGNVAGV